MAVRAYIHSIREQIAEGDTAAAIRRLRALLENSPKLDEAILQSARFQETRRQIRAGAIDTGTALVAQNQVNAGLLELLREIEQQGEKPALRAELEHAVSILNSKNVVFASTITAGGNVVIGDTTTTLTESGASRRLRVFLYFLVPVLAIGSAFLWDRYQQLRRPLQLKIRVENRTPNPELPEPLPRLVLTYGGKSETKEAAGAEALFEGIPANFRGDLLRLHGAARGFVPIDTTFRFDQDLLIAPMRRNEELATLGGIISDEAGMPVEGARVSIACCEARTDVSGKFVLHIPFRSQREIQRLDVFKTGYTPVSIETPVIPGEVLRYVLVKTGSP